MSSDQNPFLEYSTRLEARRKTVQRYENQDRLVAYSRLAVVLLFVVALWLSVWQTAISPWWIAAPVGAFLALVVCHARVIENKRRALQAVKFYEDGLARIE
ncbi:MAG TPA: DNA mismatch repair protein MutS, partial [Terriglobia bacterium]|nr:DNA mismatch repair protein MutS [Terriglobia bacterium]